MIDLTGQSNPFISFVVWLILFPFVMYLRYKCPKPTDLYEQEAFWCFQHILFGIGLAAFASMFVTRLYAWIFVIVMALVWEVYEEIRYKTFTTYKLDTVLDVILGVTFGLLYLQVV